MPGELLAAFLRARRDRVRPEDVGLAGGGTRRVPGLRREEVALLAGISADYYLRLEQGRGGQPSEQVLRALARALRLDDAGADHLLGLVAPRRAADAHGTAAPEVPPPSTLKLLDALVLPAFVTGRTLDVLASNAAARALDPELVPGRNRLRSIFLVPAERRLHRDWAATAARFVAVAREAVGAGAGSGAFVALRDELSAGSAEFRRLWAAADVVARDSEVTLLDHPVAGPLRLHLERLLLAGSAGQALVVHHPVGPDDARRLATLSPPAAG